MQQSLHCHSYIAHSHLHCKESFFTEQTSWLSWCQGCGACDRLWILRRWTPSFVFVVWNTSIFFFFRYFMQVSWEIIWYAGFESILTETHRKILKICSGNASYLESSEIYWGLQWNCLLALLTLHSVSVKIFSSLVEHFSNCWSDR